MFKKVMILVSFLFIMTSCTSTDKVAHHHHKAKFEGKCAYSISHGKHDVKGKAEFNIKYKDKIYYFSKASLRDHFIEKFEKNSEAAEVQWKEMRDPGSRLN